MKYNLWGETLYLVLILTNYFINQHSTFFTKLSNRARGGAGFSAGVDYWRGGLRREGETVGVNKESKMSVGSITKLCFDYMKLNEATGKMQMFIFHPRLKNKYWKFMLKQQNMFIKWWTESRMKMEEERGKNSVKVNHTKIRKKNRWKPKKWFLNYLKKNSPITKKRSFS